MALKFKCEKCGEEVIVRYVKPGEEALCRNCGAYVTVPETSIEAGEEPDLTKTHRYRAEREPGKLKGRFEGYRCPACGGGNLIIPATGKPLYWLFYILRVLWIWFECKSCGVSFSVIKYPKETKAWRIVFVVLLISITVLIVTCIVQD